MWPSEDHYPRKTSLWRLTGAGYGFRNASRDWQNNFAPEMTKSGFRRLESDGNVYAREELFLIVLEDLVAASA